MGPGSEEPKTISDNFITTKHTKMYKQNSLSKTTIQVNKSTEGETIEKKIRRIVNNKEPIKDGAPIVYTERKDGVQPQYNIRTDRFEIAVDKLDYVSRAAEARRQSGIAARAKEGMDKEKSNEKQIGGTESIQATDNQ